MAMGEAGVSTYGLTSNSKAGRIRGTIAGQNEAGIQVIAQGIASAYKSLTQDKAERTALEKRTNTQDTENAGKQL
jgi:hypothetical protein